MIAVIIVNYRNETNTINYINNEICKIQLPHIIIIVNNSAIEETNTKLTKELNAILITDISTKPKYNKCFVITNHANLGFAKGNNLGAEFAQKHFNINYILFSNNDIRFIDKNVVERLIDKISSLPNIGLIGPKVIGIDGKNQSPEPYIPFCQKYIWMYWLTPFLSKKQKIKFFKLNYSEDAKEGMHYKIMGSFFLVKIDDYMKCGMMDNNTFLYAEELILSERLKNTGKYTYYFPDVCVIHEHGQTISKHNNQKKMYLMKFKSELYYYQNYKHINCITALLGKFSCYLYLKIKFSK